MTANGVLRLLGVVGAAAQLKNDIVFCGTPKERSPCGAKKKVVVFFGGDVQDFTEKMTCHRDNFRYVERSLEATCRNLQQKFQNSFVLVVRPSKMYLGTFSIFENFVKSSNLGVPTFQQSRTEACVHTRNLVKNGLNTAGIAVDKFSELELTLVAFSKGCVVLNQLVNELKAASSQQEMLDFYASVKHWYWLDGGHNGNKDTWLTSEAVLEPLAQLKSAQFHIDVTPYQVCDKSRPWIGREEHKFTASLRKFGANVSRRVHFEEEERSLENHFKVLDVFV